MSSPGVIISAFLEDSAAAAVLPPWTLTYARRENMFAPGDRVLVAVSGGPDSLALLHLLVRWRRELGLDLGVGHFDHALRGRASQGDAAFVARMAQDLDLPCHHGRGEVAVVSRRHKISLQMAARKLRLNFLREVCRTQGYHKLALGHTADDQVELFLVRLLRGAGPEGLKGMWPATPDGIVRPLLAVGKEVILAWLHQENIPYRQDSTNLSRAYVRNRIRLDLLPELMRRYNPRLKQAIWRTQALLQADERLLQHDTAGAWDLVGKTVATDCYFVDLPRLLALEPARQQRLLRAAVGKIETDRTLTARQVASLLDLARGTKSGGVITVGECRVARAGSELHLFRRFPDPARQVPTQLPSPACQVDDPCGWQWRLRSRPHDPGAAWPPPPNIAWVDRDQVIFPLTVRYFRPGDRFWPQGAPGPRKLQDFLVDRKIPRWFRPHLPLVVSGRHIIWVAGLRVAEQVKVTPDTRTLLEMEMSPGNPETQRLGDILMACRHAAAG